MPIIWIFFRHLDDVEEDKILAIGTTRAFTPTPSTTKPQIFDKGVEKKGAGDQVQVTERVLSASDV